MWTCDKKHESEQNNRVKKLFLELLEIFLNKNKKYNIFL